jgi:hypothetical protein
MSEQVGTAKALRPATGRLGTIEVRVTEGIKLETLHSAIENIAKLTGCPSCGLLGIDLNFRVDPVELNTVRNLPNVNGARFLTGAGE